MAVFIKTYQSSDKRRTSDIQADQLEGNIEFTPEDSANKSTNVATDGASDVKYPSAKAVKTFVEGALPTIEDFLDIDDDFADDAAAATGGIAVGSLYHNSGAVRVRLA